MVTTNVCRPHPSAGEAPAALGGEVSVLGIREGDIEGAGVCTAPGRSAATAGSAAGSGVPGVTAGLAGTCMAAVSESGVAGVLRPVAGLEGEWSDVGVVVSMVGSEAARCGS